MGTRDRGGRKELWGRTEGEYDGGEEKRERERGGKGRKSINLENPFIQSDSMGKYSLRLVSGRN